MLRRMIKTGISIILLIAMIMNTFAEAIPGIATGEEQNSNDFKKVGSYVLFGQYEQDNDLTNGSEAIEWLVLEYDSVHNRSLIISKYGLEKKQYNDKYINITWETSALRSWLNNEFLNAAFTAAEQAAIQETLVDNSQSQCYPGWSTTGGNNTNDQLFLLSYAEANKYFNVTWEDDYNLESRVSPTAYAKAQGAYTSSYTTAEGTAAGWWWLRSPGSDQSSAACVGISGAIYGLSVDCSYGSIRPALWVNLDAGIFLSYNNHKGKA